jgi:hypothetical protein
MAIQADPKNPQPHYFLARLCTSMDWTATNIPAPKADPVKALEQAKITVDLASGPQPVHLALLARCQVLNGDKKAAVDAMKKAVAAASKEDKERYEKQLAEIQKGK